MSNPDAADRIASAGDAHGRVHGLPQMQARATRTIASVDSFIWESSTFSIRTSPDGCAHFDASFQSL
jgi:hypothetical protein